MYLPFLKRIILFSFLLWPFSASAVSLPFEPNLFLASTCALETDHAYKIPGSASVYYVDVACKKRPFRNAFIYKTYFSSWDEVRLTTPQLLAQVPNHELGFMPLGPLYDPKYGALVKTVTDTKVYFLLNNKKYWVTSEAVFNALRYQWNWIEDIDERLLSKYPNGGEITDTTKHLDGTIIKYAGDAKVYVLENGRKRWIRNEQEFVNSGYRWDRIVVIADTEVYPDTDGGTLPTPPAVSERNTLSKNDFTYVGAFRLPKNGDAKSRFGYGGGALALNPHGDPNGAADGYPGSLYVLGHDHDQLVAEINIPVPQDQRTVGLKNLNRATMIHGFVDITGGYAKTTDGGNGYRVDGLAYLDAQGSQTSPKIYWTARTYYNVDTSNDATHGMSDANLSAVNAQGLWRLGDFHGMLTGGYIFPVPSYFADAYLGGKRLMSGLYTHQGVSATSQGPALFAYGPWLNDTSNRGIANGTKLSAQALVYYPYKSIFQGVGNNPVSNFPDHKIPNNWEAGAFVHTAQKHAVVIVGQRAMGQTYYGEARPNDCNIYKGYHGDPYEPRVVFYNPSDLALAAQGKKDPTTVVPYLEWNPAEFMVPTCEWLLTGAVYDDQNKLLYILHTNADTIEGEPSPIVYVFRMKE